jgi:uncharacterized protein YjbI with pentapeptide repeats
MKQCALLGCQRPALADPQAKGFCILHAPWDGKDLSAFQTAIDEIIKEAREGSGICDFSHCYFPVNYDCRSLKQAFKFSCIFKGSKFAGDTFFVAVEFAGGAFFLAAEFSGYAAFKEAKFSGVAVFNGVKFFGDAVFNEAEFSEDADFREARFSEVAAFVKAKFSRDAYFQEAEFSRDVAFWRAKFSGNAYFSKVGFSGYADFSGVELSGEANFSGSKFSGNVDFNEARLSGEASFSGANFSGIAVFSGAEFSRGAAFNGAEFSGDADFWKAKFPREAHFGGAKFSGDAYFMEAEFSGNTHFEGAKFQQRADFSEVQTAKDATVDFQWVRFLKPQQVFFHHVDLSRWSFLDTDLRRIDFDDVTWGTIPSISPLRSRRWIRRWERRHLSRRFLLRLLRLRLRLTPTRTAIFDEIRVSKEKVKKARLAKVERLYRHLKQNYESQRDYGRAGDFYYGEMEMKRRQLNPLGQIPFWIYRILSGYGESYPRALFWLIVMWLLFAVLFTVVGYTDEWGNHADLWRSLIYSAQSMTLFHELNITFHSAWGKAIKLVASVLGVIQIALFGLALQRRFKR